MNNKPKEFLEEYKTLCEKYSMFVCPCCCAKIESFKTSERIFKDHLENLEDLMGETNNE